MTSREAILKAVKKNQPGHAPLPPQTYVPVEGQDLALRFTDVLTSIGGKVIAVQSWEEMRQSVQSLFPGQERRVNLVPELRNIDIDTSIDHDPHTFENVHVAILKGHFGVAENGAVWVTEENMGDRALPFICEHLVLAVEGRAIYPTLHEAYNQIGNANYNFGTFIAGPSKTADIEQSLVLGAHGPKSLTFFLIETSNTHAHHSYSGT
jgi:L-lactate dehydrogenase complex protein LldG